MRPIKCQTLTYPFCVQLYKITKVQTINQLQFHIGLDGTKTPILDGYWVVGEFLEKPQLGESMILERFVVNGEEIYGAFETSPIVAIAEDTDHQVFHTINSAYKVEEFFS
jgi:hypothetical protein